MIKKNLIVKILIKVTSLTPDYKLDMIIFSCRECEDFSVSVRLDEKQLNSLCIVTVMGLTCFCTLITSDLKKIKLLTAFSVKTCYVFIEINY